MDTSSPSTGHAVLGSCWRWCGAVTGTGYGHFNDHGVNVKAHRFVYEQIRGPIPDGMDIDHLCRVRNCVNPDHMEPVTRRENTLRGLKGRLVTHCPAGHAYSPDNLLTKTRRDCKRCHANKERARREAARLSATVAA